MVKVDTGADVNCINEKIFNELFPEVRLSACPHEIQNFRNSAADISILGQFHTYLEFRGVKYLNTFIVTNGSNCPNLLSYGATFRMGVLLLNYSEENVVKGENVPNFSQNGNGTSHSASNIFQILNDIRNKQRAVQYQYKPKTTPITTESEAPFRTTTPSTPATEMTAEQMDSVHVHTLPVQNTSQTEPPAHCTHVQKPLKQVLKPKELLALRKVQHPHNGRTSVIRLPLTKQDILSHYSGFFEGIGPFPGDCTNFI